MKSQGISNHFMQVNISDIVEHIGDKTYLQVPIVPYEGAMFTDNIYQHLCDMLGNYKTEEILNKAAKVIVDAQVAQWVSNAIMERISD